MSYPTRAGVEEVKDNSWIKEAIDKYDKEITTHQYQNENAKETWSDIQDRFVAAIEAELVRIIGVDKDLVVASRGKELDDKFFNSKYVIRESAKNELRAEQRERAGINLKGDKS